MLTESPSRYREVPIDGAVVGSGVLKPILGIVPGKAVVGSEVFNPTLGTAPGKAVVGSGVFNPILGTAPGKAVVGSGVFNPILGTVCGGGGQACAKADMAAERSLAPRTNRNTTTVATRVRRSDMKCLLVPTGALLLRRLGDNTPRR